jgi:hypothetical protein
LFTAAVINPLSMMAPSPSNREPQHGHDRNPFHCDPSLLLCSTATSLGQHKVDHSVCVKVQLRWPWPCSKGTGLAHPLHFMPCHHLHQ